MCSAPADMSWMTLRLGRLVISPSVWGVKPNGRTMNSTSSLLSGRGSAPVQTSTSMPSGRFFRASTVSGGSGSHTRVTSPPLPVISSMPGLGSETEFRAPVRWHQVHVVRVLFEPGLNVGAEREHGQMPVPGVVEAEPGQARREPAALEPGVDLGVVEADHLTVQVVSDEPGELAADVQLVPGRLRVVGDDRGAAGGGCVHSGYPTGPGRGASRDGTPRRPPHR